MGQAAHEFECRFVVAGSPRKAATLNISFENVCCAQPGTTFFIAESLSQTPKLSLTKTFYPRPSDIETLRTFYSVATWLLVAAPA